MFVVQLPHVPSPIVCLFSVFLLLHFLFLLFPSIISIDVVGATNGVFLLFPNFKWVSICDHGLDFLDGLIRAKRVSNTDLTKKKRLCVCVCVCEPF